MSKDRKALRKKVVSLLKGKTAAGDNVIGNRSLVVKEEDLPAIMVYPRSEAISEYTETPRIYKRELALNIEVVSKAATDEGAADSVDDICETIESIMAVDDRLDCTVQFSKLTDTTFDYQDNGAVPVHSALMTYLAVYLKGAPESRDDGADLETISTDWEIGKAVDPGPEATDTISV